MHTPNYLIELEQMDWHQVGIGVDQKAISREGKRMRIVRFSHGFREEGWCQKAHMGYVVEGEMTINFNGVQQAFKTGDALWIDAGAAHQHKVELEENQFVVLFLIESE